MISHLLKKKLTKTLLVSCFIAIIVSTLMIGGLLNTYEVKISDAYYSPSNALEDIVIVAIDEKSLQDQQLGMWPFSRDKYATVIEQLNQSSVIGIDIEFFMNHAGDSELADALKTHKVVLAMKYGSDFSFKDGQLYGESLEKPTITLGISGEDFQIGFVNIFEDDDGVIRSFIPQIEGIENHDHFAKVIVEQYTGLPYDLDSSRMLIKYYGEPEGYEYVSFSDVYNKNMPSSYFEDKIVLIGATASDLQDVHAVPISDQPMPGVEIHANLVQSILTRDYLEYQNDAFTIAVVFLFALLAGILLYRFRIHIATIILAILIIAYIILPIYTYDMGLILNILYPLISIILVYITVVVLYFLTEERSRKWITSVFGKYVSPVVINELIKNPNLINLGGEKRNITIFFSDIRGFTSISEKLTPEELVHLLNDYLTEMSSIIIKNQGLVDKYMGDAIMAFWGAPLDHPDHAIVACSSSLEMMDKLRELQKKWKKEGIPSFDIGIGLNSGDAIVGNMGSSNRFDYTAMGDNVNLASRLEGLNKIYGTNIIISEKTYKLVKEKFETRKLDAVRVKGKRKPILIYELLSKKDGLSKKQINFVKHYEEGLELYFKQKWKQAIKSFEASLKINDDRAAKVFISRCKEFIKNPPSSDWDGVWEMKTK